MCNDLKVFIQSNIQSSNFIVEIMLHFPLDKMPETGSAGGHTTTATGSTAPTGWFDFLDIRIFFIKMVIFCHMKVRCFFKYEVEMYLLYPVLFLASISAK